MIPLMYLPPVGPCNRPGRPHVPSARHLNLQNALRTPAMTRLLFPLLLAIVVVIVLLRQVQQWTAGRASSTTYRPRASRTRRTGPESDPTASCTMTRATVARLRDALTGANLDPDDELARCADCDSYYGIESVRALVQDNGARCINCGSLHRIPVVVTPDAA